MRARLAILAAVAAGLTGCAELAASLEPPPADGAVSYVRELCALSEYDRQVFNAAMAAAVSPNQLKVICAR